VRLLVHLTFLAVVIALLAVPLTLLVNESLIHLQVSLVLFMGFLCLSTAQVQVTVESVLFTFTLLLQFHKVFFVALQRSKGSLICYSHLLVVLGMPIAERVVIVAEGSIGAQESWHVGVVGLGNLLAVEGLLNDFLQVTLGLGLLRI